LVEEREYIEYRVENVVYNGVHCGDDFIHGSEEEKDRREYESEVVGLLFGGELVGIGMCGGCGVVIIVVENDLRSKVADIVRLKVRAFCGSLS